MQTLHTSPEIMVYESPEGVARAAARQFATLARAAIAARGEFSVALAGGSTPKRVYELLAGDDYRDDISWPHVRLFFGDERCVGPDHPESNYRMVNETLLIHLAIPPKSVERIKGEGDPVQSARLYEESLRSLWPRHEWPQFDLVLLGMGDDGHTASLFPHSAALHEQTAWVVANWVEKFETYRLTLTAPALNHAAHVTFIVVGAAKAARLAEVVKGAYDPERLPAQLINPRRGTLVWLIDEAVAAAL